MDNLLNTLIKNKPTQCDVCNASLFFLKNGRFYCRKCGYETLDDLGKVNDFLAKNGEHPIMFISQATGVKPEVIEEVIKTGNVEIPKDSRYYLSCEKCGCSIREGNFCHRCIREIAGDIKTLLREDIKSTNAEMMGRMHTRTRR